MAKAKKVLMGVCAKIANKTGISALLIRILWIIFGCTGVGIIVYLLLGLLWK